MNIGSISISSSSKTIHFVIIVYLMLIRAETVFDAHEVRTPTVEQRMLSPGSSVICLLTTHFGAREI
jgi:hypothetical protein